MMSGNNGCGDGDDDDDDVDVDKARALISHHTEIDWKSFSLNYVKLIFLMTLKLVKIAQENNFINAMQNVF